MKIHEIFVYTTPGILVAQYPKVHNLELTSAFFVAMRQFAMYDFCGGPQLCGDVQMIEFMYTKVLFLHSRQCDVTIAIMVNVEDNRDLTMQFTSNVRDKFIVLLNKRGSKNLNMYHDKRLSYDLKKIADEAITDFNKNARSSGFENAFISMTEVAT